MRQTATIISTYSADTFGVCSMLYELGGMVIMHDASGCNSTYTTHDEPRWTSMESMVYVSAITEMEAIMGDEEKFIGDVCTAAEDLHPKFIAICGTPIPTMIGFDFEAVARVIEARTGIMTFGFATTGMKTYTEGAAEALYGLVKRLVKRNGGSTEKVRTKAKDNFSIGPKVAVLGVTPLDFSINGEDKSIEKFITDNGFEFMGNYCMGVTLSDIEKLTEADVTLVASAAGYKTARFLEAKFGIPYVIGVPIEGKSAEIIKCELKAKIEARECPKVTQADDNGKVAAVIGEAVITRDIARELFLEKGYKVKAIIAVDADKELISELHCEGITVIHHMDEEDIKADIEDADIVIADPMYKPIAPSGCVFIDMPTESFSGRIYRRDIIDVVSDFSPIRSKI
ncbi:MAG: oxidoreductase [Lachnospiraceae bacterium]|nr:oxidoreductase [Lachnospiraceae bacterium]MBR0434522.1 oxidoreductase [Lachnospiraceae bacterium]